MMIRSRSNCIVAGPWGFRRAVESLNNIDSHSKKSISLTPTTNHQIGHHTHHAPPPPTILPVFSTEYLLPGTRWPLTLPTVPHRHLIPYAQQYLLQHSATSKQQQKKHQQEEEKEEERIILSWERHGLLVVLCCCYCGA